MGAVGLPHKRLTARVVSSTVHVGPPPPNAVRQSPAASESYSARKTGATARIRRASTLPASFCGGSGAGAAAAGSDQ